MWNDSGSFEVKRNVKGGMVELRRSSISVLLVIVSVLSACSSVPAGGDMMEKPTEAMMEKPTEVMMEKPTEVMMEKPTEVMMEKPTEVMMEKPTEVMMDSPQWLNVAFTNATTGESFKIGDYKGKVVLVELMAQWCSTCLRQQREVVSLVERLGPNEELVIVALDIDPNEDAETLKAYSESHGFGWIYAISPAEVSRELGMLYGPQYLNPPSAPMLLINRKGEVIPLPFGVKSADDLHDRINLLLNEGM